MSGVKKSVSNAIRVYDIAANFYDLNEYDIVKPSAYLDYFAQVSGLDLWQNYNAKELDKTHNLSWVLLSTAIEVVKPMDRPIKLNVEVWQSRSRNAVFRRDMVFLNKYNEVMFHGFNYTAAFDMVSRCVFKGEDLPFAHPELYEKFTIKERVRTKSAVDFKNVDLRKVYGSCIDGLGHVNNCRYGEFAYDALTEEEQSKQIKRLDICFRSELKKGDELSILKAYDSEDIYIRGCNNSKSEISFDFIFNLE